MATVIVKKLGIMGQVYSFGDLIYKQFFKYESQANKAYQAIQPTLKLVHGKHGRDSKEFIELLNLLAASAPVGAKRSNFKRKYIDNKTAWRHLPQDPNEIP